MYLFKDKVKMIYLNYYCSVCGVVISFFLAAMRQVGYCRFCNVERAFEKITTDDD